MKCITLKSQVLASTNHVEVGTSDYNFLRKNPVNLWYFIINSFFHTILSSNWWHSFADRLLFVSTFHKWIERSVSKKIFLFFLADTTTERQKKIDKLRCKSIIYQLINDNWKLWLFYNTHVGMSKKKMKEKKLLLKNWSKAPINNLIWNMHFQGQKWAQVISVIQKIHFCCF